jgi:hypothetical protein
MSVFTVMRPPARRLERKLERLRALVLMGGTVWTGRLSTAARRPVYDLPLEAGCSILDAWRREAKALAGLEGVQSVGARLMVSRDDPAPSGAMALPENGLASLRIDRDPFEYRGTGGVLRDLAAEYGDDDLLLVANAAQVLTEPLGRLTLDLAASGGDVMVVSHLDGTASGLMLVRCAALRSIAATGFVDMKEQALPQIAQRFDVSVVTRRRPTGLPIRTLDDYIEALRQHHKALAGRAMMPVSAFAEDWEPTFAIVEQGASVDPSARLHDAVVLAGGRVEAGATLVHSIVCPGGMLRRGQMTVDDLVA